MNKVYRSAWVVFAVFTGVALVAAAWRSNGGGNELIPWRPDLASARAESARDHKPVLAYFTASWCGYCQEMRHTTWSDARVESALRAYVPVKIDVDDHRPLAEQYQVEGLPTVALLDASGNVARQTSGAMTSDELLAWLRGGGGL